jgi:hypothetical protein
MGLIFFNVNAYAVNQQNASINKLLEKLACHGVSNLPSVL